MSCRALVSSAVALSLVLPAAHGQKIGDPTLFGKSAVAAQQALEHYGRWDDAEARRRVADIGYQLAGQSPRQDLAFSFFVADMREPNAFALPGGQVFVTRGMLELGLDDDQLAGLLGHEIAHVTLAHGVKIQRRSTLLNVLGQALLLGVIVASDGSRSTPPGVPYDPRADTRGARIQGAAAASVLLPELLLRSYSREFEDQADEEGQRLAAAAGYDPRGAAGLFRLMESRLPQSKDFGYWRTHPFFADRVVAADARGELLQRLEAKPVAKYRSDTQDALLGFDVGRIGQREPEEQADLERFLEESALNAWPQGPTAERLRLAALDRLVEAQADLPPTSRDYGRLLAAFERQREEVRALTPDSPFLARLDEDLQRLGDDLAALFPEARQVLAGGAYQTQFLETYLSNYPLAEGVNQLTLDLAGAYARTGRPRDAVDRYLQAWVGDSGGEIGRRAILGLRGLTPRLDDLTALEQIANTVDDEELLDLVAARLTTVASSFAELANGAQYLNHYPDGPHAETVEARLNHRAEQLYGEIVLYQGIGDSMKALQRIQDILTHAPTSKAAERLRDRAVLEG